MLDVGLPLVSMWPRPLDSGCGRVAHIMKLEGQLKEGPELLPWQFVLSRKTCIL